MVYRKYYSGFGIEADFCPLNENFDMVKADLIYKALWFYSNECVGEPVE